MRRKRGEENGDTVHRTCGIVARKRERGVTFTTISTSRPSTAGFGNEADADRGPGHLEVPSSVMPRAFPAANQVLVQSSERKSPALREFQIGGVIHGKPMPFGQPRRGRPCQISGFRIQGDRQGTQKTRKALAPFAVQTLSTFGHQERLQGFQRPQSGSDGAGLSDAIQKLHDWFGVLVLESTKRVQRKLSMTKLLDGLH